MDARRILYYITDRKAFPGDDEARCRLLLDKIGEACRAGVDFVQLREKDLPTRELEGLAREAVRVILEQSSLTASERRRRTVLLINSRTDVALSVNADGVHLPTRDVSPEDVRRAWRLAGNAGCEPHEPPAEGVRISVSCHSVDEVLRAASAGVDLALLAPIFEKRDAAQMKPQGLGSLREAKRANIPVLALGGVTLQNAKSCLQAGAAGIAAIRLFQENDISVVARTLRAL